MEAFLLRLAGLLRCETVKGLIALARERGLHVKMANACAGNEILDALYSSLDCGMGYGEEKRTVNPPSTPSALLQVRTLEALFSQLSENDRDALIGFPLLSGSPDAPAYDGPYVDGCTNYAMVLKGGSSVSELADKAVPHGGCLLKDLEACIDVGTPGDYWKKIRQPPRVYLVCGITSPGQGMGPGHSATEQDLRNIVDGARRVVAVGPAGLTTENVGTASYSYHRQEALFKVHAAVAKQKQLPLIVQAEGRCEEETAELYEELRELIRGAGARKRPLLVQSFRGNVAMVERWAHFGPKVYFGVAPEMVGCPEVLRVIPASRMILQSDSPCQAPLFTMVRRLLFDIALLRNLPSILLGPMLCSNARELFNLPK